jgi:spore maturation protein SpmA/spore maturation protein SpmB
MVLNLIWVGFFLVAFVTGLVKLLFWGDMAVFPAMVTAMFDMAAVSVTIAIGYIGLMAMWLGIMRVGELGGAVGLLSKLVEPFFSRLFPEIPKGHPAYGSIMMNFSANMLGLDNAATPLGLRAMNQLQELNPEKDRATNAQIMFLVLNTSGLTVIPVSVIVLRATNGAANPTDIFLPILIATFCSSIVGLLSVAVMQKIKLTHPVVGAYLLGGIALIVGIIFYFKGLDKETAELHSALVANLTIFTLIAGFIAMALFRRINVYESFVEGAKDGFGSAIKIIPYLVAMLVGIGAFRASGAMTEIVGVIGKGCGMLGMNTDFVEALPTAMMKPLSGSGARGMCVEAMQTFGPDSFIGKLACTFQGSTETTFFTLAVYFGAVGVTRTRYTVVCGLLADLAGIIAAIFVAYLFFH